jgi:hypothetical protein
VRGLPCRRGSLRRLLAAGAGCLGLLTLAAAAAPSPAAAATTGDATWTTLPLASGWSCAAAACGYRRDGLGFVHFTGAVAGPDWTPITTALPTGYWSESPSGFSAGSILDSGGNWNQIGLVYDGTAGILRAGGHGGSGMQLGQITYLAAGQTGQDVDVEPTASPTPSPTPTPTATPTPTPGSGPVAVVISGYTADGTAPLASLQDSMLVIGALACALLAFLVGRRVIRG